MGKGDQRSRRGKIHRGTFGRRRPKQNKGPLSPPRRQWRRILRRKPRARNLPLRNDQPRPDGRPLFDDELLPRCDLHSGRESDKQSPASVNVVAAKRRDIAPHFESGPAGRRLAIEHLERTGYRIVAANFRVPIGRNTRDAMVNAEIDIVAYDGPTLCFIEVKTRASDEFAAPQANVDLRKRRQIARAARGYRRMLGLTGRSLSL